MSNALDRIISYKKLEVEALHQRSGLAHFEQLAKTATPVRGFISALTKTSDAGKNALICELKRKSPSAGEILPGADPVDIAQDYERGGASCLSVLTDYPSFGGSIEDLQAIRAQVSLPILRKDFVIDPIQIVEARAVGADCILLILSALSDAQASELQSVARQWNLDVLTEVHDEAELERAISIGADLIGVNNRDLKAMTTDLGVSERLRLAQPDVTMVSESGVKTDADILRLRRSAFSRFLIGESLMRETNRENAVRQLVNATID